MSLLDICFSGDKLSGQYLLIFSLHNRKYKKIHSIRECMALSKKMPFVLVLILSVSPSFQRG
jgi:hypothetical protein